MKDRRSDLASVLDDGVDEARVQRLWRGVDRRLSTRAPAAGLRLALAAAIAAAALGLGARGWLATAPEPTSTAQPELLALMDGSAPVATASPTGGPARTLRLTDGSTIRLSPGAALVPTANDRRRFELELARGRASFDVVPNGPRRWIIHAGVASVEVVGTRFVVERDLDRVHVAVIRGRVRVTCDVCGAAAAERTLGAGADATFAAAAPGPNEEAEPAAAAGPMRAAPTGPPAADVVARTRRQGPADDRPPRTDPPDAPAEDGAPAWRAVASRGDHAGAWRALGGQAGFRGAIASSTAAELLLLSDVARLSGHSSDAVTPLTRLVEEHPDDPRAPLAAVMLGRLEMDVLGRPARARAALERATALGLPDALRADVERRLLELDGTIASETP